MATLRASLLALTSMIAFFPRCTKEPPRPAEERAAARASTAPPVIAAPEPVRVEAVGVPNDLPAFVLRGVTAHRLRIVFVPGACVHPGGYVAAFQHTAASRGDLVAVQGDVSCGGDGAARRWSYDLAAMDRRIDAAFAAAGLGEVRDVVLVGYSQGAERGEQLAAHYPEKYTSVVLIASPVAPSPAHLRRVQSAVLMAGTRDSQTKMQEGLALLKRARIATTFLPLSGASHGQMGTDPEIEMGRALDFVEEHRRDHGDGGTKDAQ